MTLMVEQAVGYMLKVIRSEKEITKFKDEFNAIKHGDYGTFLKLVGGELPFLVKWQNGVITNESNNPNYDCDFEGLFKCSPSLRDFYGKCFAEYGNDLNEEIPDIVYHKIVTFEIAIRMHANNYHLLEKDKRTNLEEVIERLANFKSFTILEKEQLHQARKFINQLKHQKKTDLPLHQFIHLFIEGFEVIRKHQILIV
jgi:hypothetical protein